jgi:hypothetical protein
LACQLFAAETSSEASSVLSGEVPDFEAINEDGNRFVVIRVIVVGHKERGVRRASAKFIVLAGQVTEVLLIMRLSDDFEVEVAAIAPMKGRPGR